MKFYYNSMPRYSDFNKMGILHNSKYPVLFEEGRLAMSADAGYSADEVANNGINMVISEARYFYKKPLCDYCPIIVELWVEYIKTCSIKIAFRITNNNREMIFAEGYSIHAAFNVQTQKICNIPDNIVKLWSKYKNDNNS